MTLNPIDRLAYDAYKLCEDTTLQLLNKENDIEDILLAAIIAQKASFAVYKQIRKASSYDNNQSIIQKG